MSMSICLISLATQTTKCLFSLAQRTKFTCPRAIRSGVFLPCKSKWNWTRSSLQLLENNKKMAENMNDCRESLKTYSLWGLISIFWTPLSINYKSCILDTTWEHYSMYLFLWHVDNAESLSECCSEWYTSSHCSFGPKWQQLQ